MTAFQYMLRCHACGEGYHVTSTIRRNALVAAGARCISLRLRAAGPDGMCGAPLGFGVAARVRGEAMQHVQGRDLLGYEVVRAGGAPAVDVAALQAEVDRLRRKYETPCSGLARNDAGAVVRCGGFLGHGGDCAPVW